ncbi:MAG: 16S rRNA (guanine(966)-N(2))-methyltransferase RsmD [Nitriliruptoraceae bacterium]
MMRIVAGLAKGRRLQAPPGVDVRPTADRVREALFSSLQPLLVDAHVLDLYAGSGALGLEAASRGATRVVLVERDRRTLEVLRRNVAAVDLPGIEVHAGEVAAVLLGRGGRTLSAAPFDLVLADPPYATSAGEVDAMLAALVAHLAAGAEVVVERARQDPAPSWPDGFTVRAPRRYGAAALHRARWRA